jgi:hypothetical protein
MTKPIPSHEPDWEQDMTTLRAAAEQALEALEYAADHTEPAGPDCNCLICESIEALEDRLGATK